MNSCYTKPSEKGRRKWTPSTLFFRCVFQLEIFSAASQYGFLQGEGSRTRQDSRSRSSCSSQGINPLGPLRGRRPGEQLRVLGSAAFMEWPHGMAFNRQVSPKRKSPRNHTLCLSSIPGVVLHTRRHMQAGLFLAGARNLGLGTARHFFWGRCGCGAKAGGPFSVAPGGRLFLEG